jgi:hypothetical protein
MLVEEPGRGVVSGRCRSPVFGSLKVPYFAVADSRQLRERRVFEGFALSQGSHYAAALFLAQRRSTVVTQVEQRERDAATTGGSETNGLARARPG